MIVDKKKIYERAFDRWTINEQLLQVAEECSECIQAIIKFLNRGGSKEHMIEEMMDVEIMLEEMRWYYGSEIMDLLKEMKMEKFQNTLDELDSKNHEEI